MSFLLFSGNFRFVEKLQRSSRGLPCALLPASPNVHILPCPWFIHQNQEVNIGATLFIKTLNCSLYTDVTNFSTNDLFFFCSSIQSRKPQGILSSCLDQRDFL